MRNRYKIILSNQNLYKEIELSPDVQRVTVGTSADAENRLRKNLFFGEIFLDFTMIDGNWNVVCSNNLYFNLGDVRKLANLSLEHGTECKVCYQDSDSEAFSFQFFIDFEYEENDYSRKIRISNISKLKIGGTSDSDIYIKDRHLGTDHIYLMRRGKKLYLIDRGSRYGVYVNGTRIENQCEIQEQDFFSIVGYSFYYKDGFLYTSAKRMIRLNGLEEEYAEDHSTVFEYPKFHRNTRIQYEIPEDVIEIQQPAVKPKLRKKSIVLTLMPMIVMLAMTILLRGIIGGGGTFVIYSAISMGMGIIVSLITYIQDKKDYEEEIQKRESSYFQYIDEKEDLIHQSRLNELKVRKYLYKSLEDDLYEVYRFGKGLFERGVQDKDFLQVYLGVGRIEALGKTSFTKQEFVDTEDLITMLPEQLAEKYQYIESAPVVSDFNTSNSIGIVGNISELKQFMKNITLDVVIRHFYKEVRCVYLLSETYIREFQWLRWLRNVENEMLDIRNIVCDEESKNVVLENLYVILSERGESLTGTGQSVFSERYIVFVTDTALIRTHPVSKYVDQCNRYGFTFVFLEEHEENMPQGCDEIIRIHNAKQGCVLNAVNGAMSTDFSYKTVSNDIAEQIALKLGAVCVDEIALESQLTKYITLFELLGIISEEDLDLTERWKKSQVFKTLSAPIGVKSNHEIVSLNISDKGDGHGPHGLVAGTTGSGKSEILQTYILSMATLFHPYDVGFVIIDFKGGGMANQFANLPHLIGTITNIDGREIHRSLLSIKAELVKRQEMFSQAGVNHINDYIKLFKAGKAEKPIPHLIIIVDEFAELKAEYPDFMKELISAARIGRTLGIHLILATQKPAGVVDAQIWSNSRFRLCLKVQTREDSNEVLKSPLAAEIVEPGRAYFQVGNNEIFDLIQSAYSGANVPEGNEAKETEHYIYERNLWGKKKLIYTNKKKSEESERISQLKAIVDYVELYCRVNSIKKLSGICLPSLNTVIYTDELMYEEKESGTDVLIPIGFYDDPQQQCQGVVNLELSKENVYIVGSAQMGKTVLLQTIIYGILRKYSPQQVNLYIVDCGSLVLKIFEESFHVGGVVLSNETEKCKNLFKMLNKMITDRKRRLSGKGIGNFSSYLEAGYSDMPLIVVMIDNMAAFKEYFPKQADQINSLTREAQGVGISFIVTAAASNAVNYRAQANFNRKVVLNCNDHSEYSSMLGYCRQTPRENPGSGLILLDKRILEWQAAIFGKSDKEAERSSEFKKFIEARNLECDMRAAKIPMVPDRLILENAMNTDQKRFRNPGLIPIGMDYAAVDYSEIDINRDGSLSLLGDSQAQMQFVKGFLQVLARNIVFHNAEMIIIDDRQKSLESARSYGFVKDYTSDPGEGMSLIEEFYEELEQREEEDSFELSTMMLLINHSDLLRQICSDKNMAKELSGALKRARDRKAFVILTQIENAPVGFNASEVLKTIREERQGILFAPITENKFYEVSGRVRDDSIFDQTMGYRFYNGAYSKIKIFEIGG